MIFVLFQGNYKKDLMWMLKEIILPQMSQFEQLNIFLVSIMSKPYLW